MGFLKNSVVVKKERLKLPFEKRTAKAELASLLTGGAALQARRISSSCINPSCFSRIRFVSFFDSFPQFKFLMIFGNARA